MNEHKKTELIHVDNFSNVWMFLLRYESWTKQFITYTYNVVKAQVLQQFWNRSISVLLFLLWLVQSIYFVCSKQYLIFTADLQSHFYFILTFFLLLLFQITKWWYLLKNRPSLKFYFNAKSNLNFENQAIFGSHIYFRFW